MEATLLVTPEQLETTAADFSAQATQVQALHESMLNKVRNLSNSWTGEASAAYLQKFNALETGMNTIFNHIQEHVKDLNTIASEYKTADHTITEAINDLPACNLD